MPSHVHVLIGTNKKPMEDICRDMKRHTAVELKHAIKEHPQESWREWLLWMMEKAGKQNSNNDNFQLSQHDTALLCNQSSGFETKTATTGLLCT
jgi:REP-associated tyrosine transposase